MKGANAEEKTANKKRKYQGRIGEQGGRHTVRIRQLNGAEKRLARI